MIDFRRGLHAPDGADRIQTRRQGAPGRADGNRPQVRKRFNLPFAVLNREHIVLAGPRIDPVARRNHLVTGERRDDVSDNFLLIESQFAGPGAIDVEFQRRVVHILRYIDVGHAGDALYFRSQFHGCFVRPLQI